MTIPPDPSQVPLSAATGIMLGDLVWHPLSNSLGAVIDPAFIDPLQTSQDGSPMLITPGESWVQFVDTSTGQAFAAPFRSIVAVELGAPVALLSMPALVSHAIQANPRKLGRVFRDTT
jgi:hypothetical protein